MIVGNDVVDLLDPETRPEALHPRFDQRVFTAAEREGIAAAADPHQMRWLLWAAKESAYKVAKKLDVEAAFSPTRFQVELQKGGKGTVRYGDDSFSFQIHLSDEYVHAVTLATSFLFPSPQRIEGLGPLISKEARLFSDLRMVREEPADPDTQEREACRLAKDTLGSLYAVDPERIEVVRERRIPRALYRGAPLPVDLSLSHHGRYVSLAVAYLPVEDSP